VGKSRLIQTILGFQPGLKERILFVPWAFAIGSEGVETAVDIRLNPLFADKESTPFL